MHIFLLKSGACLAIFMVFYTFFLEKENMHVFKRYYLLGALILAFSIPLITFIYYIEVSPSPIVKESFEPIVFHRETMSQIEETNYVPLILWSIYALGALVFGLLFTKNLVQIVFNIKRNPKQKSKHVIHVLLNDLVTPHTFFNYVFLNKNKFEKQSIPQEVFWHEEAHAIQKHSFDVLFIELLQVIFWFNPIIYFTKRSIKMNHEFLADQAVLNKGGIAASTYQHILLAFSSNASESPLANAINYPSTRRATSVIKKRFTVMKTHTTKRKIWLRSLVILPMLALTLYGFSEKKEVIKEAVQQIKEHSKSTNQRDLTIAEDINIKILNNGTIILNNVETTLESFETVLYRFNSDLSPKEREQIVHLTISSDSEKLTQNSLNKLKQISTISEAYGIHSVKFDNIDKYINEDSIGMLLTLVDVDSTNNDNKTEKIDTTEIVQTVPILEISHNSKVFKLNGKKTSLSQLREDFTKATNHEKSDLRIKTSEQLNSSLLINIGDELKEYLITVIFEQSFSIIEDRSSSEKQQNATPEEAAEFNKLAKQINSQNPGKKIIRQKVVDRLTYLYDRMSKEQKANAEPFPNFLPPFLPAPANPSSKTTSTLSPPPPPPSNHLTSEQKKVYMEALNNTTASQTYPNKHENKDRNDSHILVISDRDETPSRAKLALDHIADMKKNGALFFYNNKAISGEEVLNYVKTVKALYISTKQLNTKQPKVYISTQPFQSESTTQKQIPKALETNTNKDIILLQHWFITIANQKYYYPYNKGDLKKYYDKYGNEVALDIVKEYKNKNDIFEKLKTEGEHYVYKTENEKKELDQLYSDLGGMYFRMSKTNKAKVTRPTSPISPYIAIPKQNGEIYYKKRKDLTEEDMKLLPIPPKPLPPPAKKN